MRNKELNIKPFIDYLSKALGKRSKASQIMQLRSKTNFFAAKHLFDCAGKNRAAYDKLMASQNDEIVTVMLDILELWGIKDFAGLQKWAQDIKADAVILAKLLNSGRQKLTDEEFSALTTAGEMRDKKGDAYLLLLMHEAASLSSDDFAAKTLLPEFLEIIHPRDIARLYKMLLLTFAPDASVKFKKAKNKDSKPEQEQEQEAESEAEAESESDSAKLSAQLEELKAELESAYIRLNSSEENFERFQQESAELAVVDVLAKMNSQEAGKLLDQFAKSEQTLKQLASSGYEVPKELSSVSLCVRMFMQTMRKIFRISPVHVIGEKLKLTLEQAERYDYSGSDFDDSGEIKKVEVISPGWRYGKEIFSLPKVIECSD